MQYDFDAYDGCRPYPERKRGNDNKPALTTFEQLEDLLDYVEMVQAAGVYGQEQADR